ncbi:MAG: hypothetical protein PHD02_00840 [Bacilli bacterium]|nr:hypothetical protein [Bacilli bacterium]
MKKGNFSKSKTLDIAKRVLLKPTESYEENTKELKDQKTTLISGLILAGAMTIINLITAMINSIFVKTCDFWTGKCKTKIAFSGLENLDYFNLILKYFLMYAVLVFGIAAIIYILALIYKKNTTDYVKLLRIVILSFIPGIILSMILGPLFGIIYGPLNIFLSMAGSIYTMLIIINLLKDEIKLKETDNLLFMSIAFTLIYVLQYYIFIKLIFI